MLQKYFEEIEKIVLLLISCHWSLFIPPESMRKYLAF